MILYWLAFDIFGAIYGGGMLAYWAHLGGFAGGFGLAWLLVKKGVVTMDEFESSLLDIIDSRKHPEEYRSASEKYSDYITAQAQQYEQAPEEFSRPPDTKPSPKPLYPVGPSITSRATTQKQMDDCIRFECTCGKLIRTSITNAGRKGKCPQCKKSITVPAEDNY